MSFLYYNSKKIKDILDTSQMDDFHLIIKLVNGDEILIIQRHIVSSYKDCLVLKNQHYEETFYINGEKANITRDIIIPYSSILYITEPET